MSEPKKLGIAMSGSGARSIFYLGFVEVLVEEGIPIHAIAAQSGASVVATAVATGRLAELKKEILTLNWKKARTFFRLSRDGSGLFSSEPAHEYLQRTITLGQEFKDVPIKLCFPATDLTSGELVPLAYGDLAKAILTTCSVPGLLEPVKWGNKLLLDGGILSTIPGQVVKDFGVDVVISVSIRSTDHVFPKYWLKVKEWYNKFKSAFFRSPAFVGSLATTAGQKMGRAEVPVQEYESSTSLFAVLARSMDLALAASKTTNVEKETENCDLVIREGEGDFGDSFSIAKGQELYQLGRSTAAKYLVEIKKLVYG